MSASLSSAAKKAYEVAYALFRVSSVVTAKGLAEALQQEAVHLLWNCIRNSNGEAATGIHSLYYLISFGKDVGALHPDNAELLIRQLEGLSVLVAESATNTATAVDLSAAFSAEEKPAAKPVIRSEDKNRSPKAAPVVMTTEAALAPSQKERQEMILRRIRQTGNCRTSDLQAIMPDLSERTLRYDLQRLVEQGKIERGGAGPSSWYRIREALPERNILSGSSF